MARRVRDEEPEKGISRRKQRRNKRKKDIILVGVCLFSLLILIILIIFNFVKKDKPEEIPFETEKMTEEVTEPVSEEVSLEDTSSEEVSSEVPVVEYEAPEYEFKTDEITVKLPGITKEYTIAWVSDVHMVADREATDDVKEEFLETVDIRYDMFKTLDEEPVHSVDLWPEIIKYLNYNHFDGIIFGGDIMDYCSRANMDAFKTEFEKLDSTVPMMYIRADHDYGFGYGGDVLTEPVAWQMHADEIADADDNEKKFLDFGEFVIIGINRSTKNMVEGYYDWVDMWYNNAVERKKPVIIATHVPYESKVDESLYELSMEVRNKIYYWGGGAYEPYDFTKTYFDKMIYNEETAVTNVLAGHLHSRWDGPLTDVVNQHIFTPAYEGYIGIVHIIPE